MATRYFKKKDGHEVCTMSSGNRSKVQPSEPGYPYDWIEIDRKEFNKLRRQIVSGRTPAAPDERPVRCPRCGYATTERRCRCGEPIKRSPVS